MSPRSGRRSIPSYLTGRPSAEVTHDQLIEVFDLFKAAVRRAAEAGYDGIELHAAHGYMFLGSFLAPQRNRRTDDYRGDSTKGRIRVVLEALAAIRSEIGDALPITLRISGYERVAGGRPMFETAQVAPQLVAAGVDCFHVSGGVIDRLVTGMVNAADDGDALNVGAAAAVKQAVDVPVIAVGRIHDPETAEQILADGRADFIAMGRPMLADPELLLKVEAGLTGRIRRCISCENCIDAMEQRFSVDCAVNPRTGKERELAVHRSPSRKRVVVIGSGPAGMEAARVAAERGHDVTLFERNTQTGGALLWASILHPENEPFLRYLRDEVGRSDVKIELGQELSADDVVAMQPDAVVVANGGQVVLPPIPGSELPHVQTGRAMRERFGGWRQRLVRPTAVRMASKAWMPVGHRVVIVGARPGGPGAGRIPRRPRPAGGGAGTGQDNRARAGQQTQDRTHGPTRPAGGDGARACGRRADRARRRRLHPVRGHQPRAGRGQRRRGGNPGTEHRTVREARRGPAR